MSEEIFHYSRQRAVNTLNAKNAANERLKRECEWLRLKVAALEKAGDELSDTLNSVHSKTQREYDQAQWLAAKKMEFPEDENLALRVEELEREVHEIWKEILALNNRKTF